MTSFRFRSALMAVLFAAALGFAPPGMAADNPSHDLDVARNYLEQRNYVRALGYFKKALAAQIQAHGIEHTQTAAIENEIGLASLDILQLDEALDAFTQANVIYRKLPGHKAEVAATYNNIGRVFNAHGDYLKALEWHHKAIQIQEATFGKKHRETAASYNYVAVVYYNQGDYARALEWHQKALSADARTIGAHPDTANIYNNLATLHARQGNYAKELEWFQKALTVEEKILGKGHLNIATTYGNIAWAYAHQGNYPKALEWYRKALEIREKTFGKTHPYTLSVRENMQAVYEKSGNPEPFEEWLEKPLTPQ
ncbi:MAG: tetratricopeptide repeat protein [Zoogloeaceae bacterium]|jgi:tetratricopeptide (TPR) repeat protein|nr:tetratricopeptide repeat protein [Zoogloeaceae bacterium]